jgi:hypothetical protein
MHATDTTKEGKLTCAKTMLSLEQGGMVAIPRGAHLSGGEKQLRRQILFHISDGKVLLMSRTDSKEYEIGTLLEIKDGCLILKIPITTVEPIRASE